MKNIWYISKYVKTSFVGNSGSRGYYLLEELAKLGEVKLTQGMVAEVLIQTGERTALQYLLKPLTDSFARGMNEE